MKIKKTLVRITIASMLIILSPQSKAQIDSSTAASVARGLYKAAKWTHANGDKIRWVIGVMKHLWWACIYANEFVTYNNFHYRTSTDTYNYFVKGHGDFDADYGSQNTDIGYETPLQAKRYTDLYGEIIDMQYQDKNRRYHSIYEN